MIGKDDEEKSQVLAALALVTGLGITMVVSIGVCGLIGYFVDKWLGTSPVLLLSGVLFGVLAGMIQAYRIILKTMESRKPDKE